MSEERGRRRRNRERERENEMVDTAALRHALERMKWW